MYSLLVFKPRVFCFVVLFCFLGGGMGQLISPVWDLRVMVSDMEPRSFTPQGNVLNIWDPSHPWNISWNMFPLLRGIPLPLLSFLVLYLVVGDCVYSISMSPLVGIILHVVVHLLYLWKEVSSDSFYTAILKLVHFFIFDKNNIFFRKCPKIIYFSNFP